MPSLASELRSWIADECKKPADRLFYVPTRRNTTKIHQANLLLAGIPYTDDQGRYADFHSLRMSANVVLRKAGIPAKERQLFLRHGKLELTTETYDDETATDMPSVLKALVNADL